MIVMALDLDGTPPTGSPEEHHRDPPRNSRDTQCEPDAEQAERLRPPGGEWNAQRRERRARHLRPEGIARARERAFENELEALADLREGDHPQIQHAVGDHLRIARKE